MEDQLKQSNLKYYTNDDNLKMFKLKIKNVKLHQNQNNVIPLKKKATALALFGAAPDTLVHYFNTSISSV